MKELGFILEYNPGRYWKNWNRKIYETEAIAKEAHAAVLNSGYGKDYKWRIITAFKDDNHILEL